MQFPRAAAILSGRSSDFGSTETDTFPAFTSGDLSAHPRYSGGSMPEFHWLPDYPVLFKDGHLTNMS
jgi:hypothetical protein